MSASRNISAPRTIDELRKAPIEMCSPALIGRVMGRDPRTVRMQTTVNGGPIPSLRIGRQITIPRQQFLNWFDGVDLDRVPPEPAKAASIAPEALATVRQKALAVLTELDSLEQQLLNA